MKTNQVLSLVTLSALALSSASNAFGSQITSKYTSIAESTCEVVESDIEYSKSRCPGLAGLQLFTVYGDARESLELVTATKTNLVAFTAITAGAFSSLGNTVEWRGVASDQGFEPFALITRVSHVDENGESRFQNLAVIKIEKDGNACLVGKVNTRLIENANVVARNLADLYANKTVCQGEETPKIAAATQCSLNGAGDFNYKLNGILEQRNNKWLLAPTSISLVKTTRAADVAFPKGEVEYPMGVSIINFRHAEEGRVEVIIDSQGSRYQVFEYGDSLDKPTKFEGLCRQ